MVGINSIKQSIIDGKLEDAIRFFLILTESNSTQIHEELIIISSQFNNSQKLYRAGTISFENAEIAKAKVATSLVQLLTEFEKKQHEFRNEEPLQTKSLILSSRTHPFQIQCLFSNNILLGRSPDCDVSLVNASQKVSMWHARIQYYVNRNEYLLEDLDSTNGTYIQGARIEKKTTLKFGSKIQLSSALSFLFQHHENDPLAVGCLIYFMEKGDELARYFIAPKGEIKIGTNLHDHIIHPLFPEGVSHGKIVNKDNSLYYIHEKTDGSVSKIELKDQMNLMIFSIGFNVRIYR